MKIAVDNSSGEYGRGKKAMIERDAEKTDCPGLVITERFNLAGYTLTHAASGFRVASDVKKRRLIKMAMLLSKVGFDFTSFKTAEQSKKAFDKADQLVLANIRTIINGGKPTKAPKPPKAPKQKAPKKTKEKK